MNTNTNVSIAPVLPLARAIVSGDSFVLPHQTGSQEVLAATELPGWGKRGGNIKPSPSSAVTSRMFPH